ncbi:V-set and transmembrane domain-containing protein 4 isoform X2 [Bubalus bubalis]|uniref:V-set and transmembrane domain-containing protein 4 isoform X2 n=1 Tax=Bubalus bubalis TaxID=89462 RepID=UPI001E1B9BFF|nr:V-set and transmembrane domain-containing protein 4 isoform X2 [Bubalus bubalis]
MRLLALAVAVLLARAPAPEVCGALNVTVSPGPVVDYLEGENATLLCHVSQKRRKDSLLAVRWFFARPDSQEALMVKMTKLRVVQYYGNFSRSAYRQRLRLLEERRGALYTLSVLTLQPADQGHYVCKVQEISKHRNKWTAWSNGSSGTEMRDTRLKGSSCLGASGLCSSRQFDPVATFNQRAGMWWLPQPTPLKFHLLLLSWGGACHCSQATVSPEGQPTKGWSPQKVTEPSRVISLKSSEDSSVEKKKETWAFFEDLYVYAVLVCCVGILSVLLFTLTIIWQSVFSKRKSRVRHYLVKCPQNSSGETVTSVTSLAPLQPKKGKRRKEKADVPPAVPAKAPIATTFHKPKLLKPQRKVTLQVNG